MFLLPFEREENAAWMATKQERARCAGIVGERIDSLGTLFNDSPMMKALFAPAFVFIAADLESDKRRILEGEK